MDKYEMLKAFSGFLDKHFGETKQDSEPTVEVVKALDTEKRQALFVALEPQEGDLTSDLHEDTYTAEEVEKARESFNTNCMQTNVGHLVMVDKSVAVILESYITPVEFMIEDKFIKKGTWLQRWQFANDTLWEGVKDGTFKGISIGCTANVEMLGDSDEEG